MWNKSKYKLPYDDKEVLCIVRNYLEPHWLKRELGSYIGNRWYLKNGYDANESEIIKWCEIPEDNDLRTSEEWNKIYNRFITDPDGWDTSNFQYSFYEEKITEGEFTRRLLHSTQFFGSDK